MIPMIIMAQQSTSTSTTASRSFPGSTVKTLSLGGRFQKNISEVCLILLDIAQWSFLMLFLQTFALLQGDLVTFDCQFEVNFGRGIAVFHIFVYLFSVKTSFIQEFH